MQVNKYDRQIRLWGVQGQRRLSEAKVALLGCSGPGIEALKNLVLPGISHIDIWDQRKVELKDLSGSFFYAPEDVGAYRAQTAVKNLIQMNPDVKGEAHVHHPRKILQDPSILKNYNLILSGDLLVSQQKRLSQICWQNNIPVLFIEVVGFYAYIRNQAKEHVIQFERTSAKKYYLRLHDPFPALAQYSKQWNIAELMEKLSAFKNKMEVQSSSENEQKPKEFTHLQNVLSHIPYPVILIQLNQMFPEKQRTKTNITQKIKQWGMQVGQGYRDNFTQAASRYFDLVQTPQNFLRDLSRFQHPQVQQASQTAASALIFLRICNEYLKETGHLPQPTDLPDMETNTDLYIMLKKRYKEQHENDILKLQEIMRKIFNKGEQQDLPLSKDQLSQYINNIEAIQMMELGPYSKQIEKIQNPTLQWLDPHWRHILLALRSYQLFFQKNSKAPSMQNFNQIIQLSDSLSREFGFSIPPAATEDRYLRQICRVEGQSHISMHSIAGAIAGQEAIKLITKCFTPVKNGFVFSGVHSMGFSVEL